jgi:hypothetical protein
MRVKRSLDDWKAGWLEGWGSRIGDRGIRDLGIRKSGIWDPDMNLIPDTWYLAPDIQSSNLPFFQV